MPETRFDDLPPVASNPILAAAASSGGKMESIPDGDLGLGFEKSGRLTE